MSILDREYFLTIDLYNATVLKNKKEIKFYNTDRNTSILYVDVIDHNEDGSTKYLSSDDLIGLTLNLNAIRPKTIDVENAIGIVDESFKNYVVYKFELPLSFTGQAGEVILEFSFSDMKENGERLTIDSTHYTVKRSKLTDLNEAISTNEDKNVLEELIAQVQTVKNINDNTPSYIETYSSKKIENILTYKVSKEEGKGLSTNDLTNELKTVYDNAKTEVENARGTYNSLKDRLNNFDAQYNTKESKSKLKILAINETDVTGDCIILTTNNNKNIVIDTGSASGWNDINNHLSKLSQIDMLIITHYHNDHIGNLENVLKICNSKTKVILPAEPNFNNFIKIGEEYRNITQTVYNLCNTYNVDKIIASEDMKVIIDDIEFKFMNCSDYYFNNYYTEESEFHPDETDYNDFAIVTEVTHNNNKILFCSDISLKPQELLTPKLQKYNLVQAPHHGVDTNCYRQFLETIKADMTFCCSYYLSSVNRSQFGKYHMVRNVPLYVTRDSGDIEIISDGFKLHCKNTSYFKSYNMKEVLAGFGGKNFMYYSFSDILSSYTSTTTIEEVFQAMENGSLAVVNFVYGDAVTPSTISSYGGIGVLNKYSNNKASAILFDGNKNSFNSYIGVWFNGEGNIKWNKLASYDNILSLENRLKISSYSHFTQLTAYGVTKTDTALEFIKKLPPASTYEGNLYQEFASDKLSSYGGVGKVIKLANNLTGIIEMYDANSNNNKRWIGKYNSTVGDFIIWYSVEMTAL